MRLQSGLLRKGLGAVGTLVGFRCIVGLHVRLESDSKSKVPLAVGAWEGLSVHVCSHVPQKSSLSLVFLLAFSTFECYLLAVAFPIVISIGCRINPRIFVFRNLPVFFFEQGA